jgi:hypothetical protein
MGIAYDTDSILGYQYSTIFDQLLLLQLHVESANCPCSLREVKQEEIGEYCEPKHMRSICALARETIPMEKDENRLDYLRILAEESSEYLNKMSDRLCGKDGGFEDYLTWVRAKRKELEKFYYNSFCLIKAEPSLLGQTRREEALT